MRRLALALFLATSLAGANAGACTCEREPMPDVAAALAAADFVFFGGAVAFEEAADGKPGGEAWKFDIVAVWKGPKIKSTRIYAHAATNEVSPCDGSFDVGSAYVVFATIEPGSLPPRYRTHKCSLTYVVSPERSLAHLIIGELGEPAYRRTR